MSLKLKVKTKNVKFFILIIVFLCKVSFCLPIADFAVRVFNNDTLSNSSDSSIHLRFYGNEMTITIQLYNISEDTSQARRLLLHTVTSQPHRVTLNMSNSTDTLPLPVFKDNNTSEMWLSRLTREQLGNHRSEQMTGRFSVEWSNITVTKKFTLLDVEKEPLLLWSIGDSLTNYPLPLATVDDFVIRSSACAPDVALFVPISTSDPAVYIAVSDSSFSSGSVRWYNLSSSASFCNSFPSIDCGSVRVLDASLTNHHVILMTNHGLLVSDDMRYGGSYSLRPTLGFRRAIDVVSVQSAKLGYTESCHWRHHDVYKGDVVTLVYQPLTLTRQALYSVEPFNDWNSVYSSSLPPFFHSVLATVYNPHVSAIVSLYNRTDSRYAVDACFLTNQSRVDNMSVFPPFLFGADSRVDDLTFHPSSMLLYALGNKVWISEDFGNMFTVLHDFHNSSELLRSVVHCSQHHSILTVSGTSKILFSKAGIDRMVDLGAMSSHWSKFHVDSHRDIVVVHLDPTAQRINASHFDLHQRIQLVDYARHNQQLAVMHVSRDRLLVYDHSPTHNTPLFTTRSVGLALTLSFGGRGQIVSVTHNPPADIFKSVAHVNIVENFATETTSSALQYDLAIQNWLAVGTADLVLSGSGWSSSDVGKTVVVPGSSNFLVTGYGSGTTVSARSVYFPGDAAATGVSRLSGTWFIYNFGTDSGGVPTWSIVEDVCRNTPTISGVEHSLTTFELDLTDQRALNVINQVPINDPWHLQDTPTMRVSLSNPWLMRYEVQLARHSYRTNYQNLSIIMHDNVNQRGRTAVRVLFPFSSLLCSANSYVFLFIAGCPNCKRLVYTHPVRLSTEQVLHYDPVDADGAKLLTTLPVNYRPPSSLGVGVPLSDNIYNSNPNQPRPHDRFHVSRHTGRYKLCDNATGAVDTATGGEGCACSDERRVSESAAFTDCKRRVFRMSHPANLYPKFTLQQKVRSVADQDLIPDDIISVWEINGRDPRIFMNGETTSSMLRAVWSESSLTGVHQFLDPTIVQIVMNGSGLYHFRASVMPGMSYCNLSADFQIYVDEAMIAYPLEYIIIFSMSIIIGLIILGTYLHYLTLHHKHRQRRTGPLCPSLRSHWQLVTQASRHGAGDHLKAE